MPSLTIGHDVKLAYRTSFKGCPDSHKPCVLVIHPVFMSISFFDNMFEDQRICAIFNLIAFDLPYHGETTVNPSTFARGSTSYPVRETAEVLVKGLKMLYVDHVNVLGISHMGLVACELAGGWPDLVDSFIYSGVVDAQEVHTALEQANINEQGDFARDNFQDMFDAALEGDEADRSIMPREVMDGFLHALLNDGIYVVTAAKKEEWFKQWNKLYRPGNATALTKCFQLLLTRPPLPASTFSSIKCPVMLMHGTLDFLYPLQVAESFLETIPNAPCRELIEIDRGCHWSYYAPGALQRAVKFWVGVASAKRARDW